MIYEWFIFIYILRLYTGPKDNYVYQILSSPAYKKVMEKNVNLELSFNDKSTSMEKTLKEPKKAYFGGFAEFDKTEQATHKEYQVI